MEPTTATIEDAEISADVKTIPLEGKIAAAYIRLTREESVAKGLSASAQRYDLTEYAKRAGLAPPVFYEELRPVGGDVPFANRQRGRDLIADIKAGTIAWPTGSTSRNDVE
jgi:hypothetical protein